MLLAVDLINLRQNIINNDFGKILSFIFIFHYKFLKILRLSGQKISKDSFDISSNYSF